MVVGTGDSVRRMGDGAGEGAGLLCRGGREESLATVSAAKGANGLGDGGNSPVLKARVMPPGLDPDPDQLAAARLPRLARLRRGDAIVVTTVAPVVTTVRAASMLSGRSKDTGRSIERGRSIEKGRSVETIRSIGRPAENIRSIETGRESAAAVWLLCRHGTVGGLWATPP